MMASGIPALAFVLAKLLLFSLKYDFAQAVVKTQMEANKKPDDDHRKRVCLTAGQVEYAEKYCEQEQPFARVLPVESSVIETASLPDDMRMLPEIGNGHVATVVGSDTIYMNGLYNGAGSASHRARIPSMAAIFINVTSPQAGWTKKYRMDFGIGVFSEIITADDFTIQLNRYVHRELMHLVVTEVIVNRTQNSRAVVIAFSVHHGNDSEDIAFAQQGQGMMSGKTKIAEYPDIAGTIPVTMVYSTVLPNQTFDSITQAYIPFFTCISTDHSEAIDCFNEGMRRMMSGTLFSSHASAWTSLWQRGRVDLAGNVTMATITTAALYYLLSSLPLEADSQWPFVGMAAGGLAHGSATQDYRGHIFWDQEIWMLPPIALLHIDLGFIIIESRLRTLNAAMQFANATGFKGARYPWESAYTGFEVNADSRMTDDGIHISGDVSWMMRQYLRLTNDTDFLLHGRGFMAMKEIADYFLSRMVFLNNTGQYGILEVMGPDEWNYPVNNSAYVNVVAASSLYSATYAASLANQTARPEWSLVASKVYVPFDSQHNFHPEYEGYKTGTVVKQADTILLGFPLDWTLLTYSAQKNDLNYYINVTDPRGPAMSWSMFCINWLRVSHSEQASDSFFRSTWNVQGPFKVWSEKTDGSGAYNFHSGMGGYLQSLLFGYTGFNLADDRLALHPRLPPSVTAVSVVGADYVGHSFDLAYDGDHMNVTVTRGSDALVILLREDERWERLQLGVTISARCQAAWVMSVPAA